MMMKNQKGITNLIVTVVLALLFVAVLAVPKYMSVGTVENVLIKDKERIVNSEESYYLVFTDKGVYKNEDTFFFFKFNSSDVYNDLEVGQTCDLRVNWFRFGLLSWYENILQARCS
jgi:hypothetical protein